jgi:hypothetical protein
MNVFMKVELERILRPYLPDVQVLILRSKDIYLAFDVVSNQFPMKSLFGRIKYIKYLIKNDDRKWNEKFIMGICPMDLETYNNLPGTKD